MTVVMDGPAEGSRPDDAAVTDEGPATPAEEPAARAEQLFANLIQASTPRLLGSRRLSAPPVGGPVRPRREAAIRLEPNDGPEAGAPAGSEPHELMRAALAATDRIAELVDVVASQADTTTDQVVALGQAVEEALRATNHRLRALERAVGAESGPAAEPAAAERALARLRHTLRGSVPRRSP